MDKEITAPRTLSIDSKNFVSRHDVHLVSARSRVYGTSSPTIVPLGISNFPILTEGLPPGSPFLSPLWSSSDALGVQSFRRGFPDFADSAFVMIEMSFGIPVIIGETSLQAVVKKNGSIVQVVQVISPSWAPNTQIQLFTTSFTQAALSDDVFTLEFFLPFSPGPITLADVLVVFYS